MFLYMHNILVSMFIIIFPIIRLRNYMVPGQNKPQTLIIINVKMTYMYIMCFSSVLPVLKKSQNFFSIQETCEANFIGSIIG